jgi:cell division protein FtsQ
LTSEDVVNAAAVGTGGPLARVDVESARSRVLGKLPALASAEVSRSWPHTVLVEVRERSAVVVLSDGGTLRLVDASGVSFRTVPARPAGLPVVTLSAFGDSRQRTLEAVAGVVAGLPPALKGKVVSVSARTADSVTLRLSGDVTVMWGSATDADKKARVLAALLKQGAKEYDVSVPDLPTTKA